MKQRAIPPSPHAESVGAWIVDFPSLNLKERSVTYNYSVSGVLLQ